MAEASLLFVRDDRAVAERLARALEGQGISVCASASAYEGMEAYDAVIALFSSSAVRSALLMEMALAAEAEGKLVPVFVGLCHLQAPLNKLALHDLCEWNGDVNAVALQAIRANVTRIARARAAGEMLRSEMRGPTFGEVEADTAATARASQPAPAPPPAAPSSTAWTEAAAMAAQERASVDEDALADLKRRDSQSADGRGKFAEQDAIARERAHRERELRAREAQEAGGDLGDPFGATSQNQGIVDDFADYPRGMGLNEWASDVLVMTAVTVGAIVAIVAATQPELITEIATGLNREISALLP